MFDWVIGICSARSPIFDLAQAITVADLMAQQEMACWSGFAFMATLASLVVSALALIGLFISLGQTRRSLNITRSLGEAEARAYVHVAHAKHVWESGPAPYTVLLYLENVGATPAKNFQVGGELKKVRFGQVSESIKIKPYEMKAWSGLRPGQPHTSVRLDVDEYAELAREFTNSVKDHYILLLGTVRYQDIFDQWFETDFALYSHTTTPTGPEHLTKLRRPTTKALRAYEPVSLPPELSSS